ncbi:hypothetical protein BGZ88_006559 [Linnemannia elongata]|nr:hypothetical protein BGZ88_006559 [Linnemannia elongata]
MPLNEPSFHHPTIAWHVQQQQQQQQAFWAERHLDHQSIHGLEALDVRHSQLSNSTPIASSVLLSTPPSMSIIRVDSDSSPQILQQQCQQQQQSTQLVTHDAITQQQHAQQQQAQQQQLQMDHTQHQLHFQRTIVQQPQSEGTASFSGQQLAHVARLAGTHMVPTSTDTDRVSFDGRAAIYPPDRSIHDVPNNTSMSRPAVDNSTIMAYFETQPMPSDDGSGGAFSSAPPSSLTDYALMGNNSLALVSCNNNNKNKNNNSDNNINNGAALYLHDAPAHGPNFVLARDIVPPDVQHGMHHLVEQHLVFEQQQQQHASGGNAIMQAHMPETAAGAK